MIASGPMDRARAMATRWRWPPESCPGSASRALEGRPTSEISSRTRLAREASVPDAVHAQRVSELVRDVHAGVEGRRRVLEDHGDDASDLAAGARRCAS